VIPPLPPISAATPPAAPLAPAAPQSGGTGGTGFGDVLSNQLGQLDNLQQQATTATQQLATGQATDVSSVAMDVERASLALQLAVQVRTKAVDAYQELFRMQV
jgi:flagellar hook-basal body complex protein FliE